MYAHIRGTVDSIGIDRAIIEANGVGYELICSKKTLAKLYPGSEAKLLTHFHLTQDSITLYGFADEAERVMFRKLISISRIGPKVALSVLSALSSEDITLAVLTDNPAAFDHVAGMGRKTAARVILELKGKVDEGSIPIMPSGTPENASTVSSMRTEVIAALVSLGYDGALAGRITASLPDCDRTEDMLKLALKELSKRI